MKKRILALLLSLSLMVSVVVPGTVAMDGGDTVDDTYTELAVNGRETLHASQFGISAEPYQWQISIGGTWINISGETSDSITVSYAMLYNALSGDTAQVRCVGYDSEGTLIEPEAMTIRITEEVAPTPVEQEETHPAGTVLEPAKPLGDPIIEKIEGESEDIKDQIKDKFDEFKDNAKDALDQIKDGVKEKLDELKNKVDELNDPEPIDQTEETSAETTAPAETTAEPASTDDSVAADDSVVTGEPETTNVETDAAPTTDEDAGDDNASDQSEMTETTGEAEPEKPADSEDKTPAVEEPADTTTEQEVTTSAPETEAPVTEVPETDAPVATEPSEGSDEDQTEDIVISAPSFASPLTDEESSAENKENDTQTPPSAPAEQTPPTAPSDPVTTAAPEKQEEQTENTENTDENQKASKNEVQKDVPSDEQNNVPTVTDSANAVPASDPATADNEEPNKDGENVQENDTPAGETPEPTTYTILINYVFEDGTQAAPSWSATVATGSTYTQDIQSPVVVGYKPDQETFHVEASEEVTYTVTYKPAVVEFTVKHYQQNVSNDQYILVDTETKTGYTESPVGNGLAKTDYTGFYSLLYDTTTKIAADGSTVVEIYYDRYYYLMNFDLDGGHGVEPIYARYDAPISIGTPTKPGYTFKGWDKEIPKTMPAVNTSYKANWEIGTSGFIVVFWYENANDNGYSVAGTLTPTDVAPGTVEKSENYKDQNFEGRDNKHFTYNAKKAETVPVKGDGSTVLNVYYTRNTYTLTFKGGQKTLNCTKTEHTHSDSCCKNGGTDFTHWWHDKDCCKLGLSEHTHSNSCYKTSDLTITAKYQADIYSNFPIKDGNETIWWKVPQGTETYGDSNEQRYLGSIDIMPGENITFTKKGSESGAKIYYYVETLNGAAGDTTYNGKTYKQYKVIDLDYSTSVSLTYREEFHHITGFTQGDSNPYLPKDGSVGMEKNNYLYYTRNSYDLKFYNHNANVEGKGGSVQFEAPLKDYNDFTPEYPSDLKPNAYDFAGWYTTSGCFDGSEVDWDTMTMPASDVILYAKWTPKTHTVKTYLTKEEMESGKAPLYTYGDVPNGTTVPSTPKDPTRDPYKFVGWFYTSDTGEEKAFDFSMPVNRDLKLYAKWSSNNVVKYTIKYTLEDGTEIATETNGSALAGTTKTFDAKAGSELNTGYQTGYFPNTNSHSLTMDISGNNECTFIYIPKEKVKYTVRYLEKGTNTVLHDEKSGETSDAVITEKFEQITGYAPDAYQKRLVLSANEAKNVITFWYTKDETHAPVQIIHWIQNIEGGDYTEYQSSTDLNCVIEQNYSETPKEIPGFVYNKSNNSNASGTLTASGLVLNLYYDRIDYPYEFKFLEQGTNKILSESETGNARYQAQVTQTAKDIPGYTCVGAENQEIKIAIEDPADTASKNVRIFYYRENDVVITYVPVGEGTVTPTSETVKAVTGEAKGSTPTANEGFKFVGWFKDEACTEPVDNTWVQNNKITPKKAETEIWTAVTYYAKFEQDVADLTITKNGCDLSLDEHQSFIFTVTGPDNFSMKVTIEGNGSVTIKGLKIGTYTVREETGWSWRYGTTQPDPITLEAGKTNTVTFTNNRNEPKWLNGCAYKQNKFGSPITNN